MADQPTADPSSNWREWRVDLVGDGRVDANAPASAEKGAAIPTENFVSSTDSLVSFSSLTGATNPAHGTNPASFAAKGLIASDTNATTTPADLSGNVSGNPVSSEPGSEPAPTLSVNAANPSDVVFTVSGLQKNYSGTVTFTDSTGKSDAVPIAGNGTYSTNLSNLTDGTLTYVLKASDPKGNTVTVDPTTQLGLPAGVTLQQIDGGPTYYASNGFTDAANAGWDNPGFFPIGPWFSQLVTQTDANTFKAVGWNTVFGLTSNSKLSLADTNGISVVLSTPGGGMLSAAGAGPETVGIITDDEPSTFAEGASTPISSTADSQQDGRFWWVNNTWNFIHYGAWTGTPSPDTAATDLTSLITTPDGTQRSIGVSSIDDYFFANANATASWFNNGVGSFGQYELGLLDNLGQNATADEVARGSNYGQLITDEEQITGGNTPLYAYIEVGGPYTGDTSASNYITPPELNWAVWSSIIHGARGIIYFDNTFGGPAESDQDIEDSYYQTVQPGQTVSIYTQIQQTDGLVAQLAPVINSPTALNYVTVTTPSYENGQILSQFGGIEVMAKDYNGQFYIFADTADSLTQTNITATFTIADPNATSVTVVGENRTIAVVNGQFTDTFATAATVHVYEVNDNGSSPPPPLPAAPVISSGVVNSNKSVTLTGTAPDGSTVTLSDTGGTTALGTVTANSSTGAWSYTTTPLVAGGYAFTASDTTSAGTSALGRIFVTVTSPSGAAPTPTISSGVANSVQSVTLMGSAAAGATVTVSDAGGVLGTTSASGTGAWSYTTAALVAGSYAFTATDATSAAGPSAASTAFNVTVTASSAPAAPVISSGVVNSNLSVTLSGTAPGGSTVTVSDGATLGSATVSSAGAWSFTTADLPGGTYAFTATDTTSAGTSAASKVYGVAIPGSSSETIITVSSGTTSVSTASPNTYIVEVSGTLDVLSGGVVTGTTVSSGGSVQISSGGMASGTVVSSGGHLIVSSGGVASGTQINSGGVERVSSGGVDSGAGVSYAQYILGGGTASGATISSGAQFDSGLTVSTTVLSGGYEFVSSGGTASATTVSSGGVLFVSSGGVASGTQIKSGGTEYVSSGGVDSGAGVSYAQYILAGGTASGTTISSGAQFDSGRTVSTTVLSGGYEFVSSGGTASATTVSSGGVLFVSSGGVASGTQIKSGGTEYVSSGGVDSGAGVSYAQYILAGGTASGATISSGAQFDSGLTVSTTVLSGGYEFVSSGGTASATTVSSGGVLFVSSGGVASGTQIKSGGTEYVSSGGVDSGAGVSYAQYILAGGTASGATISSGAQFDSGRTVSTTVLSGGYEFVSSGGTASATTVSSGGVLFVSSGGVASGTQIKSGGTEYVSSGGVDSGAGVSYAQYILAGGTASGATISSGAQFDSGLTVSTTVLSGGYEFVSSGGTASATTVSSGGVLFVSSGGVVNHAVIDRGGTAYVSSGGTAIGTTFSGGTEVMSAGAIASGTFDFASNGDLIIDQTSGTFGASVSGLTNSGQILDFANVASSGASVSYNGNGTSGTLTVTNGTESVSVNLIGPYSAGSFKSANDGSGGIEVYDPPVVANGGTVKSSSANNLTPISGGSTTAGGLSPSAYEFNHTLFASYAAALSDQKAFGSSTPVLGNNTNPLTSASILTSPIFNQHHR